MDKFGENVDNFVENSGKSEKKEFPIVDNMEKTNEEQADKSVEEDEKIYEEELTLHPEFDFTQGNDKTLEQAIKKLETENQYNVFLSWNILDRCTERIFCPK